MLNLNLNVWNKLINKKEINSKLICRAIESHIEIDEKQFKIIGKVFI